MSNHSDIGRKGENMAVNYLKDKGYIILETNWRHGRAEIDIIVKKHEQIIFVEVKTRRSDAYGFPEEAVNESKQNKMQEAAEAYLDEHDFNGEIRFDVIAIRLTPPNEEIYHIKDAFFPFDD